MTTSLKELRQRRGYSQEELARELCVTSLTLRQWEQGRTRPQAAHIRALAQLLGVAPHELPLIPNKRLAQAQTGEAVTNDAR